MSKSIEQWTKKEFEALPCREWDADIGEFDSLVILPTKYIHDSGYACMCFVAIKEGEPICKLSGGSDVVHINGIGGQGKYNLDARAFLDKNNYTAWSIDCLPKSKLLRLFCASNNLEAGLALSSFEIFAKKRKG